MLPEKIIEKKEIDFLGKNITIKKLMIGDILEIEEKDKEEILSRVVDGIDTKKLSSLEKNILFMILAEYSNNCGVKFDVKCDNEDCSMKTPIKIEVLYENCDIRLHNKQEIEINENIKIITKKSSSDKLIDYIHEIIYYGKPYVLENEEKDIFVKQYLTEKDWEKFVKEIEIDIFTYSFKCPICKKEYHIDLSEQDFFLD